MSGTGAMIQSVVGGGNDSIISDHAAQTMGTYGNDQVFGGDGEDTLIAFGGDNLLNAGAGRDSILPGRGNDTIDGGVDIDIAHFSNISSGVSVVLKGAVFGTVSGTGLGNSVIRNVENIGGTAFADTVTGDALDNVIRGEIGGDVLDGGDGIDTADYSTSTDGVRVGFTIQQSFTGDAAGDTLFNFENIVGSNRADTLDGDAGPNLLVGGLGEDVLYGLGGADTLQGNGSIAEPTIERDTAHYGLATAGISVNLAPGLGLAGAAAGDVLISIENVIGTGFDDMLTGNGFRNDLTGGSGQDALWGLAGPDRLFGGDDLDQIYGGLGDDVLLGGDGADLILGQGNSDQILGEAGNDTLIGGSGNDTMTGGAGDDSIVGSGNDDVLEGNQGHDILRGAAGIDVLLGGGGDDLLLGGLGRDKLDGGAGNDTLSGGLTDGARDVFVFARNYDQDRVNAFDQAGTDRLDLDDALWLPANGVLSGQDVVDTFGVLNATGKILTLDFGGGDVLEVQSGAGIDMSVLGQDVWIF